MAVFESATLGSSEQSFVVNEHADGGVAMCVSNPSGIVVAQRHVFYLYLCRISR